MTVWMPPGIYAKQSLDDVADRLGSLRRLRINAKRGHPPTLMTDEQVLECRAKHEFYGAGIKELAKEYGTSDEYMQRLLSYITRSKLIPKREP